MLRVSLVATTLLGANAWLTMPALIGRMVLVPLAAWWGVRNLVRPVPNDPAHVIARPWSSDSSPQET